MYKHIIKRKPYLIIYISYKTQKFQLNNQESVFKSPDFCQEFLMNHMVIEPI